MAALKAARDFGLDPADADAIAMRFNPRAQDTDHLVDELATAMLERGVVNVPDFA
jgi:hypothetical protein